MKKSTKNKLRMYNAVKSAITSNTASWTGLPAFETAFNAFSEKLIQLESLGFDQKFSTSGISAVKNQRREEIAEQVILAAKSIKAFSIATQDKELETKMHFSPSKFLYASNFETLQLIDLVIEQANLFSSELEDFGLNAATIAEITAMRDELKTLFNSPRNAIVNRKKITSMIRGLVVEIDGLLKGQLDLLTGVLQSAEQEFFQVYTNARVIIDLNSNTSSDPTEPNIPSEPDDGLF